MQRVTTDTPKTNLEAVLNYAYAKDMRVYLRYADGEVDIDLCEYLARMAHTEFEGILCGCVENPTAETIMCGLCDGCDCPVNVLNRVAIQAAELHGRLKIIEDILGDDYSLEWLNEIVSREKNKESAL